MQFRLIHTVCSGRLVLIFAGWGMDPKPFASLAHDSYDIAVVWDYRSMDFDSAWVAGYDEVCVLAWSMGVVAAASVASAIGPSLTRCVAVNGTLTPVDDRFGIPQAVFTGTLEGLSDDTLARFDRRMCGSRQAAEAYRLVHPERTIADLADELRAVSRLRPVANPFSLAVVSDADLIFPTTNQLAAWQLAGTKVRRISGAHMPDFKALIEELFVDKQLVSRSFGSAAGTYTDNALVQAAVSDRLLDMLEPLGIRPFDALEIGCGPGRLSRKLIDAYPTARWRLWDIAGNGPEGLQAIFERCDAETAVRSLLDSSIDLIVSASTIQWFNSPERFFRECLRVLSPGGVLAFSTFIEGNLPELTAVGAHSLPLLSAEELQAILPGEFRVEVFDTSEVSIAFDTPSDALRHLRLTGVNALGGGDGVRPALNFVRRGIRTLTYHPACAVLNKP